MSDEANKIDLTFVTTEELYEELASRANTIVLVAMMKTDETAAREGATLLWSGGYHAALGMLVEARRMLMRQTDEIQPEEERE